MTAGDSTRRNRPPILPPRTAGERLWNVQEVSHFLGVPIQTLYYWRKKRLGPPAARVGRHLRYDPAHIRAWVESQSLTTEGNF